VYSDGNSRAYSRQAAVADWRGSENPTFDLRGSRSGGVRNQRAGVDRHEIASHPILAATSSLGGQVRLKVERELLERAA
jgi:hypothetical protein